MTPQIRLGIAAALISLSLAARSDDSTPTADGIPWRNATLMFANGLGTFRFDDFGDADFWGGQLHLHEAIAGAANGGAGPGLSPKAALGLGLKVDVAALPKETRQALEAGQVNLDDPAVTVTLLSLNAVVGVRGHFDSSKRLDSVGITCALCHSTVDDAFAAGVGRRRDGWANRDLDVGAIIALSPSLAPFSRLLGVDESAVREVLRSWGPGKFDAELILDGKAFQPDGRSAASLIPPAFGLAGVNLHTYLGWGSVPQWNAFVAILEMQGKGTFFDPRLNDASKFPVAAANHLGDVRREPDRLTPKAAALHFYQLALPAPKPPAGSFDATAAERGEKLFASDGKANCARCHVPPLYTEPGWNLHKPEDIGIDGFQASRGPNDGYRTTPLRGLWTHMKGGFYHDGRFATVGDVIEHYDSTFRLGLTADEKSDLAEYLKSL